MEKVDANEETYNIEKIPDSRFELIGTDKEAKLFYSFYTRSQFVTLFNTIYPELKDILKDCKDREDGISKCKEFVETLHAVRKSEMIIAKENLEVEWKKVSEEFLKALSDHFETSWPEDKAKIVGFVSNLPVFPRFLDEYQFCVGYKDIPNMIEVTAHEMLHFLWFKKWKEVFPEMKRDEYESPHLAWKLSEIMDPIILQCNPIISELIKPKKWGYSSFEKIKIGDYNMVDYFKNIYLSSVNSGDDFETTLKTLWDEAKKHEDEIGQF